ncbi:MAG: hypothetical protein ABJA98_22570 [Acidobacteriota bacterium]
MTEQELRALVRESIARHTGRQITPPASRPDAVTVHLSHAVFPLSRGSEDDGACVIEPSVRCNDCGYCLSYGH